MISFVIEFSDAILSSGLIPPLHIEAGRIIRFPGIGKGEKNKAAWCRLFDDRMGGVFGDYSSGLYEVWQSSRAQTYTKDQRIEFMRQVEASRKKASYDRASGQRRAADKAKWILSQCELDCHSYLDSKGFPDMRGNVWRKPECDPLLVVPMYFCDVICGCQLIDITGSKKFLTGQRTNDAYFKIGQTGREIICEGYATALSIHAIIAAAKIPATIYAAFSVGNASRLAKTHPTAFWIADRDHSEVGQTAAANSGLDWWAPPDVGDDINDAHRKYGLFKCSQMLRKVLQGVK